MTSADVSLLVADARCLLIRELLVQAQMPVLWLQRDDEPLAVVSEALAERRRQGQPVQVMHWVSHGQPGVLQIDGVDLNSATLLAARDQLAQWEVNTIALWACEFGADDSAVSIWRNLTGARIWSSSQRLGRDDEGEAHWYLQSGTTGDKAPVLPVALEALRSWPHQLSNPFYGNLTNPEASGSPMLAAITEGSSNPPGDTVSNLFSSSFSDTDGDKLLGVAIINNAAKASEGAWEYSNNGGVNWTAIATSGLNRADALYLENNSKIRFTPATSYLGRPGELTAVLVDSSASMTVQKFEDRGIEPFRLTDVGDFSIPSFVDIDGDGDLDAFVSNASGDTAYFQNSGSPINPNFEAPIINHFGIPNMGVHAAITWADINGDGDFDLFFGTRNGDIAYLENTGNRLAPFFEVPVSNPFGITNEGILSRPVFADIDSNGTLDAFIGLSKGIVAYFKNVGTPSSPNFTKSTLDPFWDKDFGTRSAATLADIDGDGDLDLFINELNVKNFYFQNTGSSAYPRFSTISAYAPAGGEYPRSVLADLDGDGDLDLYNGESNGNIFYSENIAGFPRGGGILTSGELLDAGSFSDNRSFSRNNVKLSTTITPANIVFGVIPSAIVATSPIPIQPTPNTKTPATSTPIDSAPAGVKIQLNDDDGDGLLEVIVAADGVIIDGNRDGIVDAEQSNVTGLPLIRDGAKGSDFGAVSVRNNLRLTNADLTPTNENNPFTVATRGGGRLATTTPQGTINTFSGALSFNVSGMAPGSKTEVVISLPTGFTSTGNMAYLRFNYLKNRFEEYVDSNGNPLYVLTDLNDDDIPDTVTLQLVDGDLQWDGDGVANGTVVDPGLLVSGPRLFNGTKGNDTLIGNVLANEIDGTSGRDWLYGGLGDDILKGGKGTDHLHGGEGADIIIGGKKWRDYILYDNPFESTSDRPDTVKLDRRDRLDFRSFDGDSTTDGRQKLIYIGNSNFSGIAGEMRSTKSRLMADTTGDGEADFIVNFMKPAHFFSADHLWLR